MLNLVGALLPALGKRNWGVWSAAESAPDLVCSDRPVVLTPTAPFPGPLTPGFGTLKTLLTVPLTRRVLLVSTYEELPSDSYMMDSEDVAVMNTYRAMYAHQIYSAEKDWLLIVNKAVVNMHSLLSTPRQNEANDTQ
jgi:hypothetical protein